jgi:DNA-damage-inducible protein J
MVHVRVDENVKAQAAETLASMGLTVSDAIRVFLTRVVADKELPFALKAPNATSRVAIAEADEIIKSRRARFATADALRMTSKKPAASKRANLPRASDYTKDFLKDWERLHTPAGTT